jgi:hypothetical protein
MPTTYTKFKKNNIQYLNISNLQPASSKALEAYQEGGKIYINISGLSTASNSKYVKITGLKPGLKIVDASFIIDTAATNTVFVGAGAYTASALKFALVASSNPANTIVRPTNLYSANATIPANGTLILAGNKKALKGKLIIDVMAI